MADPVEEGGGDGGRQRGNFKYIFYVLKPCKFTHTNWSPLYGVPPGGGGGGVRVKTTSKFVVPHFPPPYFCRDRQSQNLKFVCAPFSAWLKHFPLPPFVGVKLMPSPVL